MNYTVALDVQGISSEDELDMISGYINGEVRGVANVQYITVIDKYLAFLSVYGDAAETGDDVTFKVWDASECKLYESTYETYPFAPNGNIGSPLVEDTIHTMNLLAEKIYLNAGWNWISFNLEVENDTINDIMSSISNPTNGLIKSQTQYSQHYSSANAWVGDLVTVDEKSMYQVQVAADDSLEFYGTPILVDSADIPIVAGWNWLGYLPQGGMTPDWAFQKLEADGGIYNGDLVKNQYFFAQYVANAGWIGNLTYMNAPSGYLYSASVAGTLVYPVDANTPVLKVSQDFFEQQKNVKEEMFAEFESSNISPNQFSSNMNVIGVGIGTSDEIITELGDKVYAYIDGEVRGVSESMDVESQNQTMFFLTIYGDAEDEGKTIEFMYLDASSSVLYSVQETVSFSNNAVVGEVLAQQQLSVDVEVAISVEAIKSLTTNTLTVYPNPFTEEAIISVYAGEEQKVVISVYDNIGKLVGEEVIFVTAGTTKINFSDFVANPTNGMYHVSVQMDNEVHNIKVVNQK
jgi:hypothetical protein